MCRNIYFQNISKHLCLLRKGFSTKTESVTFKADGDRYLHKPVMVKEVMAALQPKDEQIFIDMTFGAGGHTHYILDSGKNIRVYGLDRDPTSYHLAEEMSRQYPDQLFPLLGRFSELNDHLIKHGIKRNSVDGVLFDLGCSSIQFDSSLRGFSLSKNSFLDMRMDGDRFKDQPTAADALNSLDSHSLAKIFRIYGEEKYAKKIALAIADARFMMKDIRTTQELADIVASALNGVERTDKLNRPAHVATKVFQALRIFTNNEMNELNYGLQMIHSFLKPGGRAVALSFHSLEDRIIKRHFLGIDMDETVSSTLSQKYRNATLWHSKEDINQLLKTKWSPIYKKVIVPSEEEISENPRSRSAKLRAAAKL